jgi:hypothetical protein
LPSSGCTECGELHWCGRVRIHVGAQSRASERLDATDAAAKTPHEESNPVPAALVSVITTLGLTALDTVAGRGR